MRVLTRCSDDVPGRVDDAHHDAGSASLYAIVLLGLVVAVAVGSLALVGGLAERRQLQAHADAWALAGASAMLSGEDGCARVSALQSSGAGDRVVLTRCTTGTTSLTIELTSESGRLWSPWLGVRARAGLPSTAASSG